MTPQNAALGFAGVGGLGSIFQGIGQIQSGHAEQAAYNYDAAITLQNMQQQEQASQAKYSAIVGKQASSYAKSGVDIASGSPLLVMAHTAAQGAVEQTRENQAGTEEAALQKYYGAVAAWSGTTSGIGSFFPAWLKLGSSRDDTGNLMSSIPTVTSPAVVAQPEMSPGIAGAPGQALSRLGSDITSAADYGEQVADKIRDAQNHLALLTAGNQVTAAYDKYQEQLAQSGDPDNMPDAQAWTDDLKAAVASNPKYQDPRVQRAIELHIDSVGQEAAHTTMMRQLTLQKGQEDAQLADLQQNVAFEMAEAPDLNARGLARGKYETAVADAERHGWISPKEGEDRLRQLDSTAEEVEIVNSINRGNPSGMEAMIDKTTDHPELFKDINPNRFAELKKTLRANYDTALKSQGRVDAQVQGDAILNQYRNDINLKDPTTKQFDALKAAQKVDDDPNVPTPVKKYVREELEAEATTTKKVAEEESQKAEKQVTDAMAQGNFMHARQLLKQNLPRFVEGKAEQLDKAITARSKRSDEDISNSEDAKEYLKIKQMDPDDPAAIQKEIISSPNLKTATRDKLIDWIDALSDKTLKAGLTAGDKFLQSQIAPSKGAMFPTITSRRSPQRRGAASP